MPRNFILVATIALTSSALCQTWEREDIGFNDIQSRARDLANKPYVPPNKDSLPAWMNNLSYDQYRDIRFNTNQALWAADNLPFRAMFFHPGYLYREPVILNEFTKSHQQQIRLAEAYFNYGPLIKDHGELPPDGGFAGFRLHAPLNEPDVFDELIAFQGASYWRALGKNQRYGISARGIAVDTGIDGATEDFPAFREFWLRKPEAGDTQARIYALLDGPSYTGAYAFKVSPGNETIVEVTAVLFARRAVKRLGIAPMSSMFWFGENSRRCFDDFRPEVHDSDGLAIRMGTGERIWRPLGNPPVVTTNSFLDDNPRGFGLMQRDRDFENYQDDGVFYDRRASVWVEPAGNWGAGSVQLVEIPTNDEIHDNIVAFWVPREPVKAGQAFDFSYRLHWLSDEPYPAPIARVVATRIGMGGVPGQPRPKGVRKFAIDLEGPTLEGLDRTSGVEVVADTSRGRLSGEVAYPVVGTERWRVLFDLEATGHEPVNLRMFIRRSDAALSETWIYQFMPNAVA